MVKHPKGQQSVTNYGKNGIFWDISFLLRLHSGKKKTLTSLDIYSTHLPSSRITFQNKGKVLDIVQLLDITFSSTHYNISINVDLYAHLLDLLDEDGCGVGNIKFVVPSLGTTIFVFWEKSSKCKEADYSKRLASSLLASCKGISPSPWIRLDKVYSHYRRYRSSGTSIVEIPRTQYNPMQPVHRELSPTNFAVEWCPEWTRWG